MLEKEELLLQEDAESLRQSTKEMEVMKIYRAMQDGITQGKLREKRRHIRVWTGVAMAAAALVFAFIFIQKAPMNEVADQEIRSSIDKNWTDSDHFAYIVRHDPSLQQILENNQIAPVYKSVEKNGLKLEVMGAVTDGRKLYVMYSVHNKTASRANVAHATLDYGGFEAPSIGTYLTSNENDVLTGEIGYHVYSTKLPIKEYPKDVEFKVSIAELTSNWNEIKRTAFSVPFELNVDMFHDNQRSYLSQETMIIDRQRIYVKKIEFTPLGTYVDLEYDLDNSKQIFEVLNPVLITYTGDQKEKVYYPELLTSDNSEVHTDSSKATLIFRSTGNSQPDSAELKVYGVSAVEKEKMRLVIDLNNKQIIEAPGDHIILVDPIPEDHVEEGELLIMATIENASYITRKSIRLADNYLDAEGNIHDIVKTNKTHAVAFGGYLTNGNGTHIAEISYRLGPDAKTYPQPLTIPIERYINPILETQTVQLFSQNSN